MDPITNPYAPGAGTPPPELAGRDELRRKVDVCIQRLRIGNPAKSVIMVGLRGVGKTVLLDRMRFDAEATGIFTIRIEAPEHKSLPAMLAPELRLAMLKLSQIDAAKELAQRTLRALAGFAKGLKVKFHDIEVGIDYEPEKGLADNGQLEGDLMALLTEAGKAAKAANTVLVMFIDELQYIKQVEFAALITALHRCAQLELPITMVGAGLPQLLSLAGEASPTPKDCLNIRRWTSCLAKTRLMPSANLPRVWAWSSPTMRLTRSSCTPRAIRIFCRNGASTLGMWPHKARSHSPMSKRQRN
jgi:hypothetical protein